MSHTRGMWRARRAEGDGVPAGLQEGSHAHDLIIGSRRAHRTVQRTGGRVQFAGMLARAPQAQKRGRHEAPTSGALSEWRLRRGAGLPERPLVSIIMLVLHGAANAAACLDSIAGAGGPAHEVIVVANGTGDAGLEPLDGREDHTRIRLALNTGFAQGCNVGSHLARGKYLVFLNDDVIVESGWLQPLMDVAVTVPNAGVVGSLVLFPDGRIQDAGGLIWRDGIPTRIGFGEAVVPESAKLLHDVDYVSGCAMLVPRSVWWRVGGFDTTFFPAYFEDVDFALRLHELGLRVLCEPRSRVRHAVASSTSESWRQFIITRNHERLMRRWRQRLEAHEQPAAMEGQALHEAIDHALQRLAPAA
jgi:GT2 family glycosyltransferase